MRSSVDLVKTRISLSLASSLLDSQNANYEAGMHTSGHLGGTHFWYLLISRSATVPGLYLCGFLTPPDCCGADLRAALVATEGRSEVEEDGRDGDDGGSGAGVCGRSERMVRYRNDGVEEEESAQAIRRIQAGLTLLPRGLSTGRLSGGLLLKGY